VTIVTGTTTAPGPAPTGAANGLVAQTGAMAAALVLALAAAF
jgi:hypothetical protein